MDSSVGCDWLTRSLMTTPQITVTVIVKLETIFHHFVFWDSSFKPKPTFFFLFLIQTRLLVVCWISGACYFFRVWMPLCLSGWPVLLLLLCVFCMALQVDRTSCWQRLCTADYFTPPSSDLNREPRVSTTTRATRHVQKRVMEEHHTLV